MARFVPSGLFSGPNRKKKAVGALIGMVVLVALGSLLARVTGGTHPGGASEANPCGHPNHPACTTTTTTTPTTTTTTSSTTTTTTGTLLRDASPDIMPLGNYVPIAPPAEGWSRINDPDATDAYPPTVQLDPLGSGKHVISLTSQPTDVGVPATEEREDLTYWEYSSYISTAWPQLNLFQQGQENWLLSEFMLPQSAVGNRTSFQLGTPWNAVELQQFHTSCSSACTQFTKIAPDDAFGFFVRSSAVPATPSNMSFLITMNGGDVSGTPVIRHYVTEPGTASGYTQVPYGGVYAFDHWYQLVIHVKWSSGADGIFEAWLDGHLLVSTTGPTLFWDSATGKIDSLYPVLSNYHNPCSCNSTVFYRDWKVGTTRASIGF